MELLHSFQDLMSARRHCGARDKAHQPAGLRQIMLLRGAFLCLAVALVAGCADMPRWLAKATYSPGAVPESTVSWTVEIEPFDAPAKRTLFLTVRNMSGEDDIDIEDGLRERIEKRHYTFVADPNQAAYHLDVEIRSFGETKLDGGQEQAKKLGAIAGAAARRKDGTLSNAVKDSGQGVAEAAVANVVTNATTLREWAVVADVVVAERLKKPVPVELIADLGSRTATDASPPPKSGRGKPAARTKLLTYWPYGGRVSVAAKQVGMTSTEAKPVIQPKLLAAVAGSLP